MLNSRGKFGSFKRTRMVRSEPGNGKLRPLPARNVLRSPSDPDGRDDWLKQKCVGHLLRNFDIEAGKTRGAVRFARNVTKLLKDALQLKAEKADLPLAAFAEQAVALEERMDQLCHERRRFTDPDNARFAKRLRKNIEHLYRIASSNGHFAFAGFTPACSYLTLDKTCVWIIGNILDESSRSLDDWDVWLYNHQNTEGRRVPWIEKQF